MLLLLPVGVAVFRSGGSGLKRSLVPSVSSVGLAAWVAALFYMLKMGSEATARLMLPYYPLIVIPILLLRRRIIFCASAVGEFCWCWRR